jgi:hypothetical protein
MNLRREIFFVELRLSLDTLYFYEITAKAILYFLILSPNFIAVRQTNRILGMTVFWDVALCSLVEVYPCSRGARCLRHQGDRHLMEIHADAFIHATYENVTELQLSCVR